MTVDLTYRGVGPWGAGKGTNLQASEVDSNFWEIAEAIVNLENNPALPTSIYSISVSGTQMYITLTDGTILGPYTLPVLVMRWRDEWLPNTPYVSLDVFKVTNTGIFMVEKDHVSGPAFDPDITVDGQPALVQLFGSADASLASLPDVLITDPLQDDQALIFRGTLWQNIALGTMAFQDYTAVAITGGYITGMLSPNNPSDVATKQYVDAAISGPSPIPSVTMLSNIGSVPAPPLANTLTDFLDAALVSPARGTLLYRGGAGWVALAPGTSGYFLKTFGVGADPAWAVGGSGVTSITAGSGIAASPNPIVATGTLALAAVADNTLLANITGTTVAPAAVTLSALLDRVMSSTRGSVLVRAGSGWVALAPGTAGYFLQTQGATADPQWASPSGAGTVTSVAAGTGLTTGGAPITGAGTISLAAIADKSLLANISGSSAAPGAVTPTLLFDNVFGSTQGAVIYRNASTWVMLAPGTSGQVLTSGGAAANPAWAAAPSGAPIANLLLLANISGGTATPSGNTLSNILDAIIASARGTLLYRGSAGWTALAPGTSGQVLQTGGAAGDPSWASAGASLPSGSTHDQLVYVSGAWSAQRPKYNVACYVPGTLTASQNLLFHRFSKSVTIPANAGAYLGHTSEAAGSANATGSTVLTLAKAASATPTTFSDVGTITFAAGTAVGTFATTGGAAVTFAQGDILRLRAPGTADATLADVHITLVGYDT